MKIAVFNEHLSTAGGGEKHMGSIVEYLLDKGHSVDLISGNNIDPVLLTRLKLKIETCRFINMNDLDVSLAEKSADYDFFINTTHLSSLRPKAKKNAILIFFPIKPSFPLLAKSRWFHNLIRLLSASSPIENTRGFYREEKVGTYFRRRFGSWTKKRFSFSIISNDTGKSVRVLVRTHSIRKEKLNSLISDIRVDGRPVGFEIKNNVILSFFVPGDGKKHQVEIRLRSVMRLGSGGREFGIFVTEISIFGQITTYLCSVLKRIFYRVLFYDYLTYYDLAMTVSEYSRFWLKRLWNFDSFVLYPLVEVEAFSSNSKKEKIIISCGRFFEGGHNKKHLFMIGVFKRMYDVGILNGWEYHLCGGSHPEKIHQDYLRKVKSESNGYPIYIHEDIDFDSLRNLYAKAKVFWHAAGYGESEDKSPEKFEHFGMTTVEAMSAGCIPLVIGKAGQREIVKDGVNGYLFESEDEMIRKMKKIVNISKSEIEFMSDRAKIDCKRFARDAFNNRMETILKSII